MALNEVKRNLEEIAASLEGTSIYEEKLNGVNIGEED